MWCLVWTMFWATPDIVGINWAGLCIWENFVSIMFRSGLGLPFIEVVDWFVGCGNFDFASCNWCECIRVLHHKVQWVPKCFGQRNYKIYSRYNWKFQFWYFWISGLQKNYLQHWLHLFSSLMPSKILSISVRITNLHHQRWLLLDAIVFKTTQSLPKIQMGGYGIILQIKMNAWDMVVHWWVVMK